MGRFKSLVDSEEGIESFRALYRIPPRIGRTIRSLSLILMAICFSYDFTDRHAAELNLNLVNKDSLEKSFKPRCL